MAIAFRKPFTSETQAKRDSINASGTKDATVVCPLCGTEYLLIYPIVSSPAELETYTSTVHQGMDNCKSHRPWVEMNF